MPAIRRGFLRRVVACGLAYALALQGFVFAFAQNTSATAFPLCSHNRTTTLPDTPLQAPLDSNHCAFCVAAAIYVNCAPPSARVSAFSFLSIAWVPRARQLIALLAGGSAWPRGPPEVA